MKQLKEEMKASDCPHLIPPDELKSNLLDLVGWITGWVKDYIKGNIAFWSGK